MIRIRVDYIVKKLSGLKETWDRNTFLWILNEKWLIAV